ncbi:carotenoid biosynthesis protein, partial [Acinetobacter baumannii]
MFTSYKQWFIDLTPLNLSLMFLLLLINQKKINVQFILFLCIAVLTGLMAEIIGVQTHFLFGNYAYGSVLG